MDLRTFLEKCEQQKLLLRVKKPISPRHEIANFLAKTEGKVTLFENVNGYPNFRVVGNTVSSRSLLALSINQPEDNLLDVLLHAMTHPKPLTVVDDAPVHEEESKNLSELPVLHHYKKDQGPYLTCAAVIAKDPESEFHNMSIHRLAVLDDHAMVGRIVPRHLYAMYQRADKNLDVAIIGGLHPAVMLAAGCSVEYGLNELEIASALLNQSIPVVKGKTVDVFYPANCEYVIEAKMTPETHDEGPFVDITGKYDRIRQEPVFKVKKIFHRTNPIYQALVPGRTEHFILQGMPQEPRIYQSVKNVVPEVKGVHLTPGGYSWLHAVVSIKKRTEGDGKNAILAALSGHPSLKRIIITDEDVNIHDPLEVEQALALRVRWDKDVIIISGAKGSSLDPMVDPITKTNAKIGIDATAPLGRLKEFQNVKLPGEDTFDIQQWLE